MFYHKEIPKLLQHVNEQIEREQENVLQQRYTLIIFVSSVSIKCVPPENYSHLSTFIFELKYILDEIMLYYNLDKCISIESTTFDSF